jgi:mannosidase alpha-like ER degradation enhancer 1
MGQRQDDLPPEDLSPAADKVYQDQDGHWTITDVSGLKLGVRWRLDEDGYDISKGMSDC